MGTGTGGAAAPRAAPSFPRILALCAHAWLAVSLLLGAGLLADEACAQVEVVDDLGHPVRLPAAPRRIVSLAPHATELVYALGAGDRMLAVVAHSDFPPEAARLPQVGDSRSLDLEAIAALKPDLLIVWPTGNPAPQVERLAKLGIPVYRSEPRRLSDIGDALRRLGRLLGHTRQGEKQADDFERALEALRARNEARAAVRTFYQIWPRPLMTLNDQHLASDVIRLCGGRNVFGHLAPLVPTVSEEAVLRADPELILVSAPPASDDARDQVRAWRRFARLSAVAHGEVRVVDPDLVNRPTPRVLLGARQVCEAMEAARVGMAKR